MAKRKKSSPTLRRSCGAMAAHMALLEQYPAFRVEPDAARGRHERPQGPRDRSEEGEDCDHQNRGQCRVQHGRAEHLAVADRQPVHRDEQGFPCDESRQVRYAGAMARARHGLAHPVQAGQGHEDENDADRLHPRRPGEEAIDGRYRTVSAEHAPEPVGLRAHRRSPRIRTIPRRAIGDRRRRHQLPVLRHDRHGAGSFQERPHRDARDRTLLQPAAHLGRHSRLQRLGHGGRHAELRRARIRGCRPGRTSPATTGRTAICS